MSSDTVEHSTTLRISSSWGWADRYSTAAYGSLGILLSEVGLAPVSTYH